VKSILNEYPKKESFPSLEEMFGFNLRKLTSEEGQKQVLAGKFCCLFLAFDICRKGQFND
jgi:hypothetical protein